MTENEALNTLHILLAHEKAIDAGEIVSPNNLHSQEKEALQFILEEIQSYRAIGTVEEFKALKENKFFNFDSPVARVDKKSYDKAIDDVVCKIEDYKDKHYHNRAEYPINYGLLCDMENWFLDMKGEKQ